MQERTAYFVGLAIVLGLNAAQSTLGQRAIMSGSAGVVESADVGAIPLDQGVADRGALSISLRSFSVDLAVPNDFRQLYGLPGRDPADGRYYRTQGALHAVFPESAYMHRDGRTLPLVPAGTVFHIGPPEELLGAAPAPRSARAEAERLLHTERSRIDERIDERIETRIEVGEPTRVHRAAPESLGVSRDPAGESALAATEGETEVESEPLPRFLRDEAYRRERLRSVER